MMPPFCWLISIFPILQMVWYIANLRYHAQIENSSLVNVDNSNDTTQDWKIKLTIQDWPSFVDFDGGSMGFTLILAFFLTTHGFSTHYTSYAESIEALRPDLLGIRLRS